VLVYLIVDHDGGFAVPLNHAGLCLVLREDRWSR
jgi:hypothetical protein